MPESGERAGDREVDEGQWFRSQQGAQGREIDAGRLRCQGCAHGEQQKRVGEAARAGSGAQCDAELGGAEWGGAELGGAEHQEHQGLPGAAGLPPRPRPPG
ncbi:hypothetical protein SSPO_079270 [Streptomyces antimycoticus]|uniref:Uncharacterized protein n=1 Tax=Streptomyces antimycoticus TaxID=68175 RepID=A0A499V8B0_9ACTN|nr:hypothetical protein SSPO_079270 [Streptomyces antimycoticus]